MKRNFPASNVPRATYRLQFHCGFTLREALDLVPYLSALGLSHIYASPLLMARPGSTHGYDVCDPTRINPEIGSEADLEAFVSALRECGMGLVLDIVPNHAAAIPENPGWWDVLRNGQASPFARHFDIDWHSPDPRIRGKVLLPVLGDEIQRVLERGELCFVKEQSEVCLRYFKRRFPVSPDSLRSLAEPLERSLTDLNANQEALRGFLDQQHYRLAFWRLGDQALNYRRFFTVSELVGVRVEEPQVFADTHAHILQWYQAGLLDGLRVDHPDGLYNPGQYLQALRKAAPNAWLVVEKILSDQEPLPPDWPVQGTTGYEFLNRLNGLFIDSRSEKVLTDFYASFTAEPGDFAAVALDKKRFVLRERLRAEVDRLVNILDRMQPKASLAQSFDVSQLREALIELIACFPVYRTYAQAEAGTIAEVDVQVVEAAQARASQNRPELKPLLSFLSSLLLLGRASPKSAEFVMRFQQLTGPAMAKGVEDTAFYCYNRFVVLNEVGGNPGLFGVAPERFHNACRSTVEHWPLSMVASSTHDTKRSEDVRARLALLSEIPEEWISAVNRWSAVLEIHRRNGLPDRNAEYLFYQTLVGAWPLSEDRALAYMRKAAREAKRRTSWVEPDSAYEGALDHFVRAALADRGFLADLERFIAALVEPGYVNSLAQTLVKLTAPGIPDIFQGSELWDLSLVDPDNRRAVDFGFRRDLLYALKGLSAEEVWLRRMDGLPKLWLIWRTLSFRAQRPELFGENGSYDPLEATGERAENLLAFARGGEAITIVPRLVLGLKGGWADTSVAMPFGVWQNELTSEVVRGGSIRLGEVLNRFPVALLSRTND
jgi:(1->4)-alpha-D-glucan 1-alpha-D-glucosylmutase